MPLIKKYRMKTFILAPDSFKESMTAEQACASMQRGILRAMPDAQCIHVPMADGGEGTVDALIAALAGERIACASADQNLFWLSRRGENRSHRNGQSQWH